MRWSVADGKALPAVPWGFKLIHQRDGVVLHRNAALLLRIGNKLVLAQTKLAGALSGLEVRSGREVRPIDRRGLEHVHRLDMCCGDRAKRLGEIGGIHERHAGSHIEATRSAYDDQSGFSSVAERLDLPLRDTYDRIDIVLWGPVSTDNRLRSIH